MKTDYTVIHSEPTSAKILVNEQKRATLQKINHGVFSLQETGTGDKSRHWRLSVKIDGEMRPFSIACYETNKPANVHQAGTTLQTEELCLMIKDHIFSHNNNFYSIGEAIPEGVSPRDYISGSKYICRLVNFPHLHIDHVDEQTKHQMKRHRGIAVGEFGGLGADAYHLKLYGDELTDIGLQLAASTYVIYTTR